MTSSLLRLSTLSSLFIFIAVSCENRAPVEHVENGISFSRHVEPVFQQNCVFSGCHSSSFPAAGLDLTTPSYSRIWSHQPVLFLGGDPENSYLVKRLTGEIAPQMPLYRPPLPQSKIDTIKQWIREGAANN